jgi:hypothetical protein
MFVDPSIQELSLLDGVSTSRVLNLASIAERCQGELEYTARPLFASPTINRSIILKHRVRPHEDFLFGGHTDVATKIVIPLDPKNLRKGGHSFFVNQRGFRTQLKEVGGHRNGTLERDANTLQLMAALPSLDPFILCEYLKLQEIEAANCYFAFAADDRSALQEFATGDVLALAQLVVGENAQTEAAAARLAAALVFEDAAAKLDPFRAMLTLNTEEFRNGIFAWRAFLFYKWRLHSLLPEIEPLVAELRALDPAKSAAKDQAYVRRAKRRVADWLELALEQTLECLEIYDAAYGIFTQNRKPHAFREFLLNAPDLFLHLSDKIGMLSHCAVVWQRRSRTPRIGAAKVLREMEGCFAVPPQPRLVTA